MTGLWLVTGVALALAVTAWLAARRTARRLAQLSEMYWELKYQQLELRKQVQGATPAAPAAAEPPPPARESFVPLASLRR
jgi:HAMP domain-containing protein